MANSFYTIVLHSLVSDILLFMGNENKKLSELCKFVNGLNFYKIVVKLSCLNNLLHIFSFYEKMFNLFLNLPLPNVNFDRAEFQFDALLFRKSLLWMFFSFQLVFDKFHRIIFQAKLRNMDGSRHGSNADVHDLIIMPQEYPSWKRWPIGPCYMELPAPVVLWTYYLKKGTG